MNLRTRLRAALAVFCIASLVLQPAVRGQPVAFMAFDCWEKARVDPALDTGSWKDVRTVFGYGSLIFRPGFPYCKAYPATVRGFIRRFWQRSCDHRGTPEKPGRVLALLKSDLEDPVVGMAYDVEAKDWPEVLEALDIRERHGYTRTVTELFSPSGNALGRAVVYFASEPEKSAAYTGPEPIEETAAVIATAEGPSGPNDAYLFSLLDALESNGLPEDPYLKALSKAVREKDG